MAHGARIETALFVTSLAVTLIRCAVFAPATFRGRPTSCSSDYEPGGDPNELEERLVEGEEEIEEAPLRELAEHLYERNRRQARKARVS